MKRDGRELSKVVLGAVMITYGIMTLFGIYIVGAKNNDLLPELLTFVGAPTSVAIGFYAWKAKAENMLKISKSQGKNEAKEYIEKVKEKLKEMEEENYDS